LASGGGHGVGLGGVLGLGARVGLVFLFVNVFLFVGGLGVDDGQLGHEGVHLELTTPLCEQDPPGVQAAVTLARHLADGDVLARDHVLGCAAARQLRGLPEALHLRDLGHLRLDGLV